MSNEKISYKEAGVDIDAGNSFVERIKPLVKSTFNKNVLGDLGSYSGAFALPAGYREPVLFGATDGVGTKLKLAIDSKKFDTVGIDLVAMCVNDLICNFAEPIFFLDYYATGKLEVDDAVEVLKGITEGCRQAESALIGGETAEMPGMYHGGDFDLAGFAVGIAEKSELGKVSTVKSGDVLVALPSSGVHSNGYSLVRKVLFDKLNLSFDSDFEGKKLIDVLLEPTRIYVKTFKDLKSQIKALSHITGGGIVENLPRVLPEGLSAVVQKNNIKILPIFKFLSQYVEEAEMFRAFNMGVGMILVVAPENAEQVLANSDGYVIGHLEEGKKEVKLV